MRTILASNCIMLSATYEIQLKIDTVGFLCICSSDSSGSVLGDLPETVVDPHYPALWAIQ